MQRIYLDNAATSWPKPEAVYAAVDHYQRTLGAPAGRGTYAQAAEVERQVLGCRLALAELLHVSDPRRIVLTFNGTDALNLALDGLLRPGDHVVTSVCEHNSVLRPLAALRDRRQVAVTYVPVDRAGRVDPDDIRRACTPRTRVIALVHASNVTGTIQPAEAVGQIAREAGAYFLLDAAQTLGYLPVDVQRMGVHLLAAPGHKGLLGPLGTGLLYVAEGVEAELQPIRQGGTGTHSEEEAQPRELPDRYEAGNLNVPGIVGLQAGVRHVLAAGVEAERARQQWLMTRLLAGLHELDGVQVYGPPDAAGRVGLVSLRWEGLSPQELASVLDAQWSIQTRAGLHCAPRMHASLGTLPEGTLRLSVGHFTTLDQIDTVLAALATIVRG
jgi:cysteine desulfurase/selenocysteine lyase